MNRVYTLIFVGCIGLSGFAAHAQQSTFEELRQELMADTSSDGTTATVDVPTIDDSLLVIETPALDINQSVAEHVDSKTNRYPPRLRISFSEFPLRSLAETNRTGTGRTGTAKTRTEVIAQRIQVRLRAPQLSLVVKDRVATISGTVATERQRSLAASMLCFEPGIDAVQNEIAVAATPEQ